MSGVDLDTQAVKAAKGYMGELGWPTILLALACFAGYLATPLAVITGAIPLWLGVLLIVIITYAAYTPMHDAAHGSIVGKHRSYLWLQTGIGYMMGFILALPFSAHRYEHLAHHRHTNDPDRDPDFQVSDMGRSPFHAILSAYRLLIGQYSYYFQHRARHAPWSEKAALFAETVLTWGARVGFLASGYWVEGGALLVLGHCLGVCVLAFLFAYIVHKPHQVIGRYVDTSTIQLSSWGNGVLTWCWLFQNYHSIHHLFPKVPFYRYRELFEEIEPVMRAKGAPIYSLSLLGLQDRASI